MWNNGKKTLSAFAASKMKSQIKLMGIRHSENEAVEYFKLSGMRCNNTNTVTLRV